MKAKRGGEWQRLRRCNGAAADTVGRGVVGCLMLDAKQRHETLLSPGTCVTYKTRRPVRFTMRVVTKRGTSYQYVQPCVPRMRATYCRTPLFLPYPFRCCMSGALGMYKTTFLCPVVDRMASQSRNEDEA